MKPTVGQIITVVTEYNRPSIWGYVQHNEITGEVVNYKWQKPEEFAIRNPKHPKGFSVIHMKNVVDIRDQDGKEYKFTTDPSVRVWTVTGSKGDKYTVNLQNGEYSCDCIGFQYRKDCKHIKQCISD